MGLTKAGADVNAKNISGLTLLFFATENGTPENINTLLNSGACANVRDERVSSPWNLAQEIEKLKNNEAYWASQDAKSKIVKLFSCLWILRWKPTR